MTLLAQIAKSGAPVAIEVLEEAVRGILAVADPDKILLFGPPPEGHRST